MDVERLTPLDAWFLAVEDGIDHMHMALVSVLEGPCPSLDELRGDMDARLDRIPRYRQRVVRAPLGLGSPVWADDPDFDVANHVHAMRLYAPGDDHALADLVGEVISAELDRNRPLWDITLVEGLAAGQWATVIRVHHSLTDGVGGSALMAIMVDLEPDAAPLPPSTWEPTPLPSHAELLVRGVRRHVRPIRAAQAAAQSARTPLGTAQRAGRALSGLLAFGHDLPPTRRTILNGPLGPARSWASATTAMADVEAVRAQHDVTVNDVALTAIAGGIADLLTANGEPIAGRDVRCLVPVSLRSTDVDGVFHNRVAAMVADLPIGIPDPIERLHEVHIRMNDLKSSHEADFTAEAVEASELLPYLPVATAFRVAVRLLHTLGQRNVNAVTTNVPGPPVPLYWMGRRILRNLPVTPIGESVRLGVAIHSYNDQLTFGITSDRSALPDVAPLGAGIERDIHALAAASRAA